MIEIGMQYTIVVTSKLAFAPQDFAAAWNADPKGRAIAKAHTDQRVKSVYEPGAKDAFLTSLYVQADIETTEVCHSVQNFLRRQLQEQTEIVQVEKPDGTCFLVIKGIESNAQL